jgi:hypothetical protein
MVLSLHPPHPEAVSQLLPDFVRARRSRNGPSEGLIALDHLAKEVDVLRSEHQDLFLGQLVRGQTRDDSAKVLEHCVQVFGPLALSVIGDGARVFRLGHGAGHVADFSARPLFSFQS